MSRFSFFLPSHISRPLLQQQSSFHSSSGERDRESSEREESLETSSGPTELQKASSLLLLRFPFHSIFATFVIPLFGIKVRPSERREGRKGRRREGRREGGIRPPLSSAMRFAFHARQATAAAVCAGIVGVNAVRTLPLTDARNEEE